MSRPEFAPLLETLLAGQNLSEAEAAQIMAALADDALAPAMAGSLLTALRAKGETADEIRGFAAVMRERALRPDIDPELPTVDTVGTGGDGSGSYNLSTGTALLAAAAGALVVKHGNRSVSSKSGSADVLESLGLGLPLDAAAAGRCLEATNFTFLFAPAYHPAMKSVVPVRQAMGVRTVFNVLGPLTNPAQTPYQVIGAFSKDVAALMADALSGLAIERAFVVHGDNGWDEATPVSSFTLFDVTPGQVVAHTRPPEDYGIARCAAEDLAGGDADVNARAMADVLRGADTGAHRDALLMGTSLVLEVAGLVDDARAGVARAQAAIDSGDAARLLDGLAEFGRG
ncbi:MAG: anthranilate phosphoribosyltransferase [Pseudomonadota bacterium]